MGCRLQNEIKDFGGKASTRRSARQTEDARFWLITGPVAYHPIARQLVVSRKMDVTDSARFMALVAMAEADAYIAVMDGKYHYDIWRPITAIRTANLSGNPAVAPEAGWQPIDNTHRWTNPRPRKVSEARIWAGFHYRFSTRTGEDMGRKVGQYVAQNVLKRAKVAEAR